MKKMVKKAIALLTPSPKPQIVDIPAASLIYPHRYDIMLRIQFLQALDSGGIEKAMQTPYMKFIKGPERLVDCPSPEAMAQRFVDTYRSLQQKGLDTSNRVTVVDRQHPHFATLPPERKMATALLTSRYSLFDGAHRLASLVHLGHKTISCEIVNPPHFSPPDYTSFIDRSGLECDWQRLPGMGEWPRTDQSLRRLHNELWQILSSDSQQFGRGQFYQSCEDLSLTGQRPTSERFKEYRLGEILLPTDRVLDIGANCGFFSLKVSPLVASVEAVEINPLLIQVGRKAKEYLGRDNCAFFQSDFKNFTASGKYDVILSFAVHHWVGLPFGDYMARLHGMLNDNGRIVLESQETKKLDADWDSKIATARQKGFTVIREGEICDDWIIHRRYVVLKKVTK